MPAPLVRAALDVKEALLLPRELDHALGHGAAPSALSD